MDELPTTYLWATSVAIDPLAAAVRGTLGLPLVAVGSGGSLTVADYAATLHREFVGEAALAQTPLDAVFSGVDFRRLAIMITTAGGRNPDVVGSFQMMAAREAHKLVVLCLRSGSPLAKRALNFPYVDFVDFAPPFGRDGFLATNSLIASVVLLARAYSAASGKKIDLPRDWRMLTPGPPTDENVLRRLWERDTLLVLHGAETRAAAIDIESKFAEAALSNVWTADFRQFAHGRHHWLAKRAKSSAVLAIVTAADAGLATRTLALVPKTVPVLRQDVPFSGVVSSLAALARVMQIVGSAGNAAGIDPGRPGVPAFGRRIYHLSAFPSNRRARDREDLAIERKTGITPGHVELTASLRQWKDAYREFTKRLERTTFRGIVLDYDGTLCSEHDRFGSLGQSIARELVRLLRNKLLIGIATGRGKSVRLRLQTAIPRKYWTRVLVGYYNGGDIALLGDDTRPDGSPTPDVSLRVVAAVMRGHKLLNQLATIEYRIPQITIGALLPRNSALVWDVVQQIVLSTGSSGLSFLRSSHSMDIVAEGVAKTRVVDQLAGMTGAPDAPILCIGDRGRFPGNDHVLLNSPYGLSVDEPSPSPSSGWNLAPLGHRGADACLAYLRCLKPSPNGAKFVSMAAR